MMNLKDTTEQNQLFFFTHRFERVEITPGEFIFRGGFLHRLEADFRARCVWYSGRHGFGLMVKSLFQDGGTTTVTLRICEALSGSWWGALPAGLFRWILKAYSHVVMGRGATFGPGLVLLHPFGVFIHKTVRAGNNLILQNSITLGAEDDAGPSIGDNVFVGVGARVIGPLTLGDRCRIGANAVVLAPVQPDHVAAGNPARQIPVTAGK